MREFIPRLQPKNEHPYVGNTYTGEPIILAFWDRVVSGVKHPRLANMHIDEEALEEDHHAAPAAPVLFGAGLAPLPAPPLAAWPVPQPAPLPAPPLAAWPVPQLAPLPPAPVAAWPDPIAWPAPAPEPAPLAPGEMPAPGDFRLLPTREGLRHDVERAWRGLIAQPILWAELGNINIGTEEQATAARRRMVQIVCTALPDYVELDFGFGVRTMVIQFVWRLARDGWENIMRLYMD